MTRYWSVTDRRHADRITVGPKSCQMNVDTLWQLNRHYSIKPGQSTESTQRFVGDVCRPRSVVEQPAHWQVTRHVEEMVVFVAEAAGKLYQRPRPTTQIHTGRAALISQFLC